MIANEKYNMFFWDKKGQKGQKYEKKAWGGVWLPKKWKKMKKKLKPVLLLYFWGRRVNQQQRRVGVALGLDGGRSMVSDKGWWLLEDAPYLFYKSPL